MKIYGLVLAGGEGSRLGGARKADLRIGGRRLADRVVVRLGAVEAPVLFSTRGGDGAGPGVQLLADDPALCGPVAGIAAGLRFLRQQSGEDDVLVTVAVDTPFLPEDYLPRLVAPLEDRRIEASFAGWRGEHYFTNAAWRIRATDALPLPPSPRRLLETLGARVVDWNEAELNPFANLNTLADLVALQRRARRMPA